MRSRVTCYMHRFTAEHRCSGCGRWERGFAPKVETKNAKPRSECQVCERQQALDGAGKMVHHGYQRPGWGSIVGDCFGVNHQPFPATDALEKWMGWLVSREGHLEVSIAKMPETTELMVRDYNTKAGDKKISKVDFMDPTKPWLAREWETQISNVVYRLQQELKFVRDDQKRVSARILKGQEMTK